MPNVTIETLSRQKRSDLEYYHCIPEKPCTDVKLIFIHGAFSNGWVWSLFFQPYFAKLGFESYALNLRGRRPIAPYLPTQHGLSDYASDVEDLIDFVDAPYILVGHSLGGLIAQKVSALTPPHALALLASVPPEGLAVSAWQMALSNPLLFWNTAAFSMSPQMGNTGLARDALFSKDADDDLVETVLRQSAPEAPRALMEAQMPLAAVPGYMADTPVFVFGGANDKLIPASAVQRTADFHGVEPVIMRDLAHAVMIDTRWSDVANTLHAWMQKDVL